MRFASSEFLWGTAFALVLAAILVAQGLRLAGARKRFGQDAQVLALLTAKSGLRRGTSAVLVCLAVALSFVAAAQPQYGKGTRVLPATNLDVVLVLDYSKSMYARDVTPSRIERAKVEVVHLVRELAGARFGAVAFAGESISFPLTSDGAAIAQFFRGLTPNDMAVGGTAIARALGSAQNLLERDPLSKNHERVLVLVTDGEDLEGDPVQVAREAASSGIRVEVVQIGGQTPEPIPELDDEGRTLGMRRDSQGRIMTTQLSAEGEAQLLQIASEGQGELVKASAGQTGIDQMTARLRRLMTEELSERVETVYADVFQYPLALAIVLLMAEVWIGTAPKRRFERDPPKGPLPRRRRRAEQRATILLVLCGLGCEQVHPLVDDVFVRESPEVNAAIEALSKQEGDKATQILTEYLETGPCEEGSLGVGERARERQHAAFDLALALSQLAHKDAGAAAPSSATGPGAPPGMPPSATPPAAGMNGPAAPKPSGQESMLSRVSCALRLLGPLSIHREFPAALRARSHYLAGNLEMLRTDYEAAIESYDQALLLAPGVSEGAGDSIGAKIAHNRALALRLLQEQKKQEEQEKQQNQDQESGDDDKPEQDDPGEEPKKEPEQEDNQEPEQPEQNEQAEDEEQAQDDQRPSDEDPTQDQGQPSPEEQAKNGPTDPGEETQPPQQDPAHDAKNSAARDERMLDLLEQAPTLQQHDAKQRQAEGVLGRPTMEDK